MRIKIHTFIKGVVWELLGVAILFTYMWLTTKDLGAASAIGLGYPAIRVIMWYPYERLFKRIRRNRNTVERVPFVFAMTPLKPAEQKQETLTVSCEVMKEARINAEMRATVHEWLNGHIDAWSNARSRG